MTPLGFGILDQISGLEPNIVQDRELKQPFSQKGPAAVMVGRKPQFRSQTVVPRIWVGNTPYGKNSSVRSLILARLEGMPTDILALPGVHEFTFASIPIRTGNAALQVLI